MIAKNVRPPAIEPTGQPIEEHTRSRFERQLRHDFSRVRIHTDRLASRLASSVHARAFAYGNDIFFASGAFAPESTDGRRLIAHELAHTVQQRRAMAPYVARAVDDWLTRSVNVRAMSYSKILAEIDELTEWITRRIESSPDTERIEESLALLRREAARREALTRRPSRRSPARTATHTEESARPTRRPRVLVEMSSVDYEDPVEMRAELDLVMQWLARADVSSEEREILLSERDSLAPQFQEERRREQFERQALRLRTALSPDELHEAAALEHAARTIRDIEADPQNPELCYVYDRNERIPISLSQASALKRELSMQLRRLHSNIASRVDYYWGRYQEQVRINEDTFLVDNIAGWLGGVEDPGGELASRHARAIQALDRLDAHIKAGRYVDAAAMVGATERDSQVIAATSRAFYEGHIEGAQTSVTALEFTRDASFAVAGSIAAVVAAPVVAGAAAGAGLTGVSAGTATILGTGTVVGTGAGLVRGTSSAAGQGLAGGSLEDVSEAFIGESVRGFKEGFLTGAAGGAARVLGPALGIGANVSAQGARRVAAEAIVDGTSAMVETLLRGGSIEEAVAAGLRSAALSVPGGLVSQSGNRLVQELGGPLTAGAAAYVGAIASGASPEEAMRSAGLAVTSNLVMNRTSQGTDLETGSESFRPKGLPVGPDALAAPIGAAGETRVGKPTIRGATAEGVGEAFEYTYQPAAAEPEVRYQALRRPAAIAPTPQTEAANSPRPARSPEDLASVVREVSEDTATYRSPADPDVLNSANPSQVEEITLDRPIGLTEREVWEPPSGAARRPSESDPMADRLAWLRQRLEIHVDQAIERFEVEGLSPRQERAQEQNPGLLAAFRGSRVDQFAKDTIMQDPDLQQLILAPDFVRQPDILDSILPQWFDMTTRAEWKKHLERYQRTHGEGVLLETRRPTP